MRWCMMDIIFAGIVALCIVLVDGGVALMFLSASVGDALLQRIVQDIGAAMIAASPFILIYQLLGWADARAQGTTTPRVGK
jgi:hypothetical protein